MDFDFFISLRTSWSATTRVCSSRIHVDVSLRSLAVPDHVLATRNHTVKLLQYSVCESENKSTRRKSDVFIFIWYWPCSASGLSQKENLWEGGGEFFFQPITLLMLPLGQIIVTFSQAISSIRRIFIQVLPFPNAYTCFHHNLSKSLAFRSNVCKSVYALGTGSNWMSIHLIEV